MLVTESKAPVPVPILPKSPPQGVSDRAELSPQLPQQHISVVTKGRMRSLRCRVMTVPSSRTGGSKHNLRAGGLLQARCCRALPLLRMNSLAPVQHLHSSQIKQETTRVSWSCGARLKAPVLEVVCGGAKK